MVIQKNNMSLKEKINQDFITAMKAKDLVVKSALSGIKSKITEAEKAKGNVELSDQDVLKVITTGIKQRKQSYDAFVLGNREDLATKEQDEIKVLEVYLPKQMTELEIQVEIRKIVQEGTQVSTNTQALIGKIVGEFNRRHQGMADVSVVKKFVTELINP